MRNLFSILGGLLSGLLYVMMRAVLLLDALIDRICSLRVWRRIGGLLGALRRRRSACAICAFLPFFLLPGAMLTRSGAMVSVDGRPLGVVENADELTAAVAEIESDAKILAGDGYTLPISINCTETRAPESRFLTSDGLKSALVEATPDLDTLAVITVDGEQAGVCRTAEDAQTLLDRIKAKYTTASDDGAQFMQAVHVQNVIAPVEYTSDFGELYEYLSPRLDVTATRNVTYTEQIPYETITRENDERDQTYQATLQPGHEGEAVVTAEITTVDGQEHGRTILERTVLSQATNEIVEVGTKNVGIGTGTLDYPLTSYTFTSAFKWRWGRLHSGVDLATPEGSPVYAADNGKVILAECSGDGYGNYIILDHGNGMKTLYGHNSELLVSVGDVVAKGDRIALSGNTGNSTGPHVHFETIVDDEKVDPQIYLSFS